MWGFENIAAYVDSVLALALGVHSSAAVPRPAASSLMPLRCAHQVPGLRTGLVGATAVERQLLREIRLAVLQGGMCTRHARKSRSAVHLAQRHKGGGRRPGDSRGAKYAVGLVLYKTKGKTKDAHDIACPHLR